MLRALFEQGIRPDLIAAVSIGAWNGALLAQRPTSEGVEALAQVWKRLTTQSIFTRSPWLSALWNLLARHPNLVSAKGMTKLACSLFGEKRFEDLSLPLVVLATDMSGAQPHLFDSGPLLEAIRASSALPGLFPPVEVGGRYFIDGAVVSNVPLAPAVRMGAQRIVILDAGVPCQRRRSGAPGLLEVIETTITVASRQRVESVLPHVARQMPVLYLSLECPFSFGAFDFDLAPLVMEKGYEAARKTLAGGWPPGPGLTGHPHDHEMDLLEL